MSLFFWRGQGIIRKRITTVGLKEEWGKNELTEQISAQKSLLQTPRSKFSVVSQSKDNDRELLLENIYFTRRK